MGRGKELNREGGSGLSSPECVLDRLLSRHLRL